ncbi:hypothetical protein [Malonomonas rubra]|uniref:hypothetical protein n=1 Tax=Malonomonas rubra TaxID=57040 RepID=UPI0026F08702|nr:hypothetical protein [Malonomonas rubra]
MLEEVKRYGAYQLVGDQRDVAPINPILELSRSKSGRKRNGSRNLKKPPPQQHSRRRFTAMRDLINELKNRVQISHVDFITANQELIDLGVSIAKEELLAELLLLKVPLGSIKELSRQILKKSYNPHLGSGRDITPETNLFPVYVEDLSEYLLRFVELRIVMSQKHNNIFAEINNNGRFFTEHNRVRLSFTRSSALPTDFGAKLELTISIQVGAVEIDENGRRAILYQRPDQSFGLYSDKLINLSI